VQGIYITSNYTEREVVIICHMNMEKSMDMEKGVQCADMKSGNHMDIDMKLLALDVGQN